VFKTDSRNYSPVVAAFPLLLLTTFCSSNEAGVSPLCTPFATQVCWCPGAAKGGQMCKADATGWTECDCGSPAIQDASPAQTSGCAEDSKAATNTCMDNAVIRLGTSRYWISNNVWGRPSGDTSSQQCSWFQCFSGDALRWGTSWNWTGGRSVKSYPSVVLGWHWGLRVANTGLPVQIAENRTILTGWDFTVTQSSTGPFSLNVAYDLWVHAIPNPGSSGVGADQPSDEVMIWLDYAETVPAGSPVALAISLAGATWDLWEGPTQDWTIHSFVRTTNTNSAALNIADFLNYLVTERGLDDTKYLTSIAAGTEILIGSGEVNTSSYYCSVQ
jgi:xyloglucan-specific endo-beta-1,4-glucanase